MYIPLEIIGQDAIYILIILDIKIVVNMKSVPNFLLHKISGKFWLKTNISLNTCN